MTATTITEKESTLALFKNIHIDFHASSLALEIGMSRVGTFKALKNLETDGIVIGKNMGKSRFYQLNNDEYALKNVETLLLEEQKKYRKWKVEFEELYQHTHIVILFGSIIKNERKANDIDLLLVYDLKRNNIINKILEQKNELLIKKIHPIKQTLKDMKNNIEKMDKVILGAIKNGIVLHGTTKYVEWITNVAYKK